MVYLAFFKDKKKAKRMMLITGILTAAVLLAALISGAIYLYKLNAYEEVSAIVTDFDTRDGNNVWTEFTYEYEGVSYNVRRSGHSYWMRLNSEVDMLVHPSRPDQAEVAKNSSTLTEVLFIITIPFAVFFLLYSGNYIIVRKKQS